MLGASIASSTSSNGASPRSEHAVSSPPLLRAITEQASMEEREAAAFYEDEISPFQQFIENVDRGASTCWPYAELDFLRADQASLLVGGAENGGGLAGDSTANAAADGGTATAGVDFGMYTNLASEVFESRSYFGSVSFDFKD